MRKPQQTIRSREALFSIWYSLCEEDRRSAQEPLEIVAVGFTRCLREEDTPKTTHSRDTCRKSSIGFYSAANAPPPPAEKATLLSELNNSLAKELQPRANLAATEKNHYIVLCSSQYLFLSVPLHMSVYLYSTCDRTETSVA